MTLRGGGYTALFSCT